MSICIFSTLIAAVIAIWKAVLMDKRECVARGSKGWGREDPSNLSARG